MKNIKNEISVVINEYLEDVNHDIIDKIENGFLKNKKISELKEQFLKTDIMKYIVDNFSNIEITQKGKDEIEKIGLNEQSFKTSSKEDVHLAAFESSEKETISVEYISTKTNVIFLHAFIENEFLRPTEFSPLNDTSPISLKNQCDLIRATKGEISTSTALLNGERNMSDEFNESYIGIVISSGVITSACRQDSYTVLDEDGVRRGSAGSSKPSEILQAIEYRNSNDLTATYNELIVRQPDVAGIYYKMDVFRKRYKGEEKSFADFHNPSKILNDYYSMTEAASSIEGKRLPILAMYNGKIHEMSVNIEKLKEYCIFDSDSQKAKINPECDHEKKENKLKLDAWLSMSEQEITSSIFNLGKPLNQDDLLLIGKKSSLDSEQRLTILKNSKNYFKSDSMINLYEERIKKEAFKSKFLLISNKLKNEDNHQLLKKQSSFSI